jgi:hypothetical protein
MLPSRRASRAALSFDAMSDRWLWTILHDGQLPLWPKVLVTAFICVLVPVYWAKYGPTNFLWFSDIALFGAAAALWLENRLLASMMILAATLPELAWNLDFFSRLIFGRHVGGMARYMFDPQLPLWLRGISLFHVALPPLLGWLVYRLGYDPRALPAQTALAWVVLPVCYLATNPARNINWVFGPDGKQTWMPPLLYLLLLMLFIPACIYLPTHWLLLKLSRPS